MCWISYGEMRKCEFFVQSALSARLRHRIIALKKYDLTRFAWPARCPSAPLKISKCYNQIKFYVRQSGVNLYD